MIIPLLFASLVPIAPVTPSDALCSTVSVRIDFPDQANASANIAAAVDDFWTVTDASDPDASVLTVKSAYESRRHVLTAQLRHPDSESIDEFRTASHRSVLGAGKALGEMIAAAVARCGEVSPTGHTTSMEPLISDLSPEGQAHLESAVKQYEMGNYRASIEEWKNYLSIAPGDPYGHSNLGVAYIAVEQWAAAARSFQQSVRLNRHNDLAWYNLGFCYWKLGRIRQARSALHGALKINPEHPKAKRLLEHLE